MNPSPLPFQVRFHGRGGQGVVTAAELLSVAAFLEGRFSQAFPTFGSERAGAPVAAFCRVAEREIRTRSPVSCPDALVVQDPTLLHQPELFAGLSAEGYVIINTSRSIDALGLSGPLGWLRRERVVAVGATELALKHLGRPIPNAVLLGALAGLCSVVSLDAICRAIDARFSATVAKANRIAATEAYGLVLQRPELSRASSD